MTLHPDRPPNQPYFRGISDLPGELGDLFYGPYGRSTNHYVKDGSTVRKRDGYVRAYDEEFEGSASVLFHRDGATRYQLVADGEGVKVLDSLPPSYYTGITADHSGFVNDDFERSTTTVLTDTTHPWVEGQDSVETPTRTMADTFRIRSNSKMAIDAGASALIGGADWLLRAPTPFSGYRVELDFSDLTFASNNDSLELYFFMGLPDLYLKDDGSVGRERMYAVDAFRCWQNTMPGNSGQDQCWQGLGCKVTVSRDTSTTRVIKLELASFVSSERTESNAERFGRLGVVNAVVSQPATTANVETSWLLEFGRRKISDSSWTQEARLWKEQTIEDLENGTIGTSDAHSEIVTGEKVEDKVRVGGYYQSLSKDGSGGYFGMVGDFSVNTAGIADILEIKATTGLA